MQATHLEQLLPLEHAENVSSVRPLGDCGMFPVHCHTTCARAREAGLGITEAVSATAILALLSVGTVFTLLSTAAVDESQVERDVALFAAVATDREEP